jgi:RND family efflux transporter MFP subunit
MKKKNIILSIAGIIIVAFIAFTLIRNKKTINSKAEKAIADQLHDVIPVKTALVKLQDISNNPSESGTFKAVQELKITAQSQGQITKLLVKKTQFVRKGTLLAVIDNSSMQSQIETAQSALDKAKEDAKRYNNALSAGGVSKQQVEEAQLRVKNAESQLTALKQQSHNYQIIAPMDGVINDIYAEAGSNVSPGAPLLEIVDITKVNLTIHLEQESLSNLKLGQKVNVTSDIYPGKIFEGTVSTVNVKTDLSQKIEVGIIVANNEKTPLLSGMYGHAEFITGKKQEKVFVMMIPRDAIIGSIQDAKVFVVNPDSTVAIHSVSIGRIINNDVEVVNGLTENQQVVTAGQINLENGTKVSVKN